jgi:hypothetical protein
MMLIDIEPILDAAKLAGKEYVSIDFLKGFEQVDAVPVVRGEWVMDTDPDDGDCRCSNCHICIDALHRRNHKLLNALGYKLHTFYKYCPKCGCKMEDKP